MLDMDVGTEVYWTLKTKTGELKERAGVIFGIVFPECHPNSVFPNMFSPKITTRNYTSYLVRVAGTNAIFWPPHVYPLPSGKQHLLLEQAPITSKRLQIDRSDRFKIRKLCKKLGWEFSESTESLSILTANKRFWFRVFGGEEFICNIENIRFQ